MNNMTLGIQADTQWKTIFLIGGIAGLLAVSGTLFDIVFASASGTDLSAIPVTAIGRFEELHENRFLGLYHFDLLNVLVSVILVPVYVALFCAHRNANLPYAFLALVLWLLGTMVFITTNSGLAMLELSRKYYATADETRRAMLAAAGEALLVRGAHGSLGVFAGFFLSGIGSLAMSLVVAHGRLFGRFAAVSGIAGHALLLAYIVLIACFPRLQSMMVALAAPGGLLALAWMVVVAVRLLSMSRKAFCETI